MTLSWNKRLKARYLSWIIRVSVVRHFDFSRQIEGVMEKVASIVISARIRHERNNPVAGF